MVYSIFRNQTLVVTLFWGLLLPFNHAIATDTENEVPDQWVKQLQEGSQASREAIQVPPQPPMDRQTAREKLQLLLATADGYAEALRIMGQKYKDFLTGVAKVNATCDVDLVLSEKRSQSGALFSWVYQLEVTQCQKEVGALKDYARELGTRLDGAEKLLSELKEHAVVASRILDRMRVMEQTEGLERRVKQGGRILDQAEDKINRLGKPDHF